MEIVTDSNPLVLVSKVHQTTAMHIPIERLYDFVMGLLTLSESEQSHLIRCRFCVEWLDACVMEKVFQLTNRHGLARSVTPPD